MSALCIWNMFICLMYNSIKLNTCWNAFLHKAAEMYAHIHVTSKYMKRENVNIKKLAYKYKYIMIIDIRWSSNYLTFIMEISISRKKAFLWKWSQIWCHLFWKPPFPPTMIMTQQSSLGAFVSVTGIGLIGTQFKHELSQNILGGRITSMWQCMQHCGISITLY